MKRRFVIILLALSMSIPGSAANASLLGQKEITIDTVSGFEWLDINLALYRNPREKSSQNPPDNLLRSLIKGTWAQISNYYAVSEFSADGRYEALIYRSKEVKELLGHLIGSWRIEKGHLHILLTEATPPLLEVGEDIREKIARIGREEMVLVDDRGERYTKVRIE